MTRGLHRFTVFVTCATFILIVAGALVTSNGAGLAAPDWPLSWGKVFPPMVGNLFYEHGHRLIASSVGLLTIILNVWLWRSERRLWVRRLGLIALGVVIAQGLLGGLTVKLMLPVWVSSAHACLAQLFFCTMVSLSVFTAPQWDAPREQVDERDAPSLRYLCVAAFAVTFAQLVLGATLRHSASWDEHLPASLLLAHIIGALCVTLVLGGTLLTVLGRHRNNAYLSRPALLGAVLLVLQLCLGLVTYLARRASPDAPQPLKPIVTITVAHVACGALVLATIVVLTLRVYRVLRPARATTFELSHTARRVTT
jgi:cytochrome c oxidase assembly protein subunit 15